MAADGKHGKHRKHIYRCSHTSQVLIAKSEAPWQAAAMH